MNLAIRGIAANLGEMAANTFTNDQHKDLKADYIMANPPFNQKEWRGNDELIDDPRWNGYEVPPTSNANYGWILNIVSKLSQNGVAGFLLANGALSDDGTELKIRQQLIENNLVEAIIILPRNLFYTTDISVTLWILNKNKKLVLWNRTVSSNAIAIVKRKSSLWICVKWAVLMKRSILNLQKKIEKKSRLYITLGNKKDMKKLIRMYRSFAILLL